MFKFDYLKKLFDSIRTPKETEEIIHKKDIYQIVEIQKSVDVTKILNYDPHFEFLVRQYKREVKSKNKYKWA